MSGACWKGFVRVGKVSGACWKGVGTVGKVSGAIWKGVGSKLGGGVERVGKVSG